VSPACLGVDQFASCWAVPTKKFRSSREALTTLWLIRHSYRKRTTIFFFCRCLHKTSQDLQLWTFWHLNAFVHKPEVHAFAESWSGVRVAGLWNVPHTVPLDGGCSLNQCFCRLSHQVTKHSLSASIFPVFFSRCCSLREDKKNVELSWCLRANLRHNLKPNPPQLILFVL
jgi:hypothetical protein